ncbi:hypothetical protein I7I48_11674 [Histoplasma ohiense]|nr:hypothetical protein I7I48_11674 [Histoplasma ohiense (nom. inval.)]
MLQRRAEAATGEYSGAAMITGPITISVTTVDHSLIPTSSATFSSTSITRISSTSMDKRIGALGSRDLGPGVAIGSCTWPTEDVTVTDSNHHTTVYPQILCRDNTERCCPLEGTPDTPLSACPQGYVIAGENTCCPRGWSVFSTLLGTQTPCYSKFSTAVPPAATASADTSTTTIRTALFAKKYDIVPSQTVQPSASLPTTSPASSDSSEQILSKSRRLSDREIAGVVTGSVLGIILFLGIAVVLLRRWKRSKVTVDDLIRQPTKGTHELAPTDNQYPAKQPHDESWMTGTTQSVPINPANSNHHIPMAYLTNITPTIRTVEPQELPGNTFINEYHPAYRNDPCPWRVQP